MGIKKLSVEYDAGNEDSVFARGDPLTGRVVLELSKQTNIQSLSIEAKGKASVKWTESYGHGLYITYTAKEKYLSIKKSLVDEASPAPKVMAAGTHEFPFSFEIPNKELPSSFRGKHGKIIYHLEARAGRSMRPDRKTKEEFFIVYNEDLSTPDVLKPQYGNCEKKLLTSGNVLLNVHTKRMGYQPGDTIEVRTEIINNSKNAVTPKYYLYEKQCFYTKLKRKVYTKNILKETGQPVGAGAQLNDTKGLHIPELLPPTLLSCNILTLEYRLKVVLDVSLMSSAEVKQPVVVMRESKMLDEIKQGESLFG